MKPKVSLPDPGPVSVPVPNILADSSIPRVGDCFPALGPTRFFHGRPTREELRWADALLVRTVTPVDGSLLGGSRVRWVGSASSGIEHLRCDELARAGIAWTHAPGCNAEAVAEYVLSALLLVPPRRGKRTLDQTVAIIGCGHAGSRLERLLRAAGVRCLLNDPPLAEQGDGRSFVDLNEALQADVVSLHVPLTRTGRHATANLIDERRIRRLREDTLLINTSRGGVVDEDALVSRLNRGELRAAIDVWRNEPAIDTRLLALADIATAHIAGYSRLAKQRATLALRDELCRFIGAGPPADQGRFPDQSDSAPLGVSETGEAALRRACRLACDPLADTGALRSYRAGASPLRAGAFQRLRKNYALRKEFSEVRIITGESAVRDRLARLGFDVTAAV